MADITQMNISDVTYTINAPKAQTVNTTIDATTTTKLPVVFSAATTAGYNAYKMNTSVAVQPSTGVLFGAAWNDYAEYRQLEGLTAKPGEVVCETGHDTVERSAGKLGPAPAVVSNTYGFIIGEEENSVPVAVAGKVLVYVEGNREKYKVGDVFCAGADGKACLMTKEEIKMYPDRILGYYVGTPDYEYFNDVPVDGRVWIRIK